MFISSSSALRSVNQAACSKASAGIIIIFALWIGPGMLTFIPNNGGSGLSLPGNGAAWSVIAIMALWLTAKLPASSWNGANRTWRIEHYLLIGGLIIWSLPLLWSPLAQAKVDSAPHIVALWLLVGFWWLLARLPASKQVAGRWLLAIWLGGLSQSVYALLQVTSLSWTPLNGLRPYGFFQQTNVLASFIATGLICLLYSWLYLAAFRRILLGLACAGLIFMPFVLVLLQSRAGYLGAGYGAAFLIVRSLFKPFRQEVLRKRWLALLLLASGVLAAFLWQRGYLALLFPGYFSLPVNFSVLNKSTSTLSRIIITQTTWHIIMHHPWLGVGYGLFEHAFAQQIMADGHYWGRRTLIHPHNELLYACSEGGIIALGGVLLMVDSVLIMLFRRRGAGVNGVALLMPLALHMNLEFPLYQSTTHAMLLVILLYLTTTTPSANVCGARPLPAAGKFVYMDKCIRLFYIIVAASGLIYSLTAIHTGILLTRVEREGLMPLALNQRAVLDSVSNTYSQYRRIDFDRHVALLMKYNITRDKRLLTHFYNWSTGFISLHNNADVSASRLQVIRALYPDKFQAACRLAHQQWREDERFSCQ